MNPNELSGEVDPEMGDTTGAREEEHRTEPLRFRPSTDTVARRMEDQYVLVDLRTNRIYELNRTGARLWELLETGHDLEQAQEQMLLEFDVDKQRIRNEVSTLMHDLVAQGLLEPHAES
jgi:coenzyme PQQ synthesis protein D (PqqD)